MTEQAKKNPPGPGWTEAEKHVGAAPATPDDATATPGASPSSERSASESAAARVAKESRKP